MEDLQGVIPWRCGGDVVLPDNLVEVLNKQQRDKFETGLSNNY